MANLGLVNCFRNHGSWQYKNHLHLYTKFSISQIPLLLATCASVENSLSLSHDFSSHSKMNYL